MITPQQIQEISFDTVRKGGYDMESVDRVLEPLTEDYITLYKENSILKSKMRILVEKLEEYRNQESSMQSALMAAQRTCEQMTLEAEKKCAQMLREAEEAVAAKSQNVDLLIGEEQERLDAARAASQAFIDSVEKDLMQQLELLKELRTREFPQPVVEQQETRKAFDFEEHPVAPTTEERADALIEEIGQTLEMKLSPIEPPKKFEHLEFGKNYTQES
ncbi:MAG: DivIVA domain-containing protein [Oscillospiraceae bacterium]|nr:DivIVA domain-containing protein [Oscillospiraceae bacterium]